MQQLVHFWGRWGSVFFSDVPFVANKRALGKVINPEGGFFLIQGLYDLNRERKQNKRVTDLPELT